MLERIGDTYGDFVITNAVDIPEIQCKLFELIHRPTGAQVMHLANEDPENLFCLSFQTIPSSSNGVAHILEHTVLCGSKKYPLKDPFFCMRRRSLNTFMNAMTGPDFTCYPASSQVPKDFYNLLEVYLDAVFHPLLDEHSFHQEGHRLEFAKIDDPSSPLMFKGVVYNEMKGALSNPVSRIIETINLFLFPDLTYGVNSGGDPKEIPNLTYEELLDFHRIFYHPSRCLFYFYGNMPLKGHLDFIAKHVLDGQKRADPLFPLLCQKRFTEPKKISIKYPASSDEELVDKTWISFSWLTCDVLQQDELLALLILEIALLDTDASPLKLALLKSGLCTQVSTYLETDIKEAPWVILIQGCNPENADPLEKVLFETLDKIMKEGIPKFLVDNALHQLELHRSEITGGHTPFGLNLFLRAGLLKLHGAEANEALMIHSIFQKIRDRMATDAQLFPHLISKYLINNRHFVRVVMEPDPDLTHQENDEEAKWLKRIQEDLTEEKAKELIHQAKELQELQSVEEDLKLLPKIHLTDVPKLARDFPLIKEIRNAYTIYRHECFTNNITYADLIFPMPFIAEEELVILRLFFLLFTQMGCGGRTYAENLDYIQAHTGGIGSAFSLNLQADDYLQFHPYLYIQGKALNRKVDKLFSLYKDFLISTDFTDRERIKEVILKHYTGLKTSINQNQLNYAINLSSSGLNAASKIVNECYGLPYYHKIKELAQAFDEKIDGLIDAMQEMQNRLLNLEGPHLVITCQEEMYRQMEKEDFYGLTELQVKGFKPWKCDIPTSPISSQGRKISSPVAFTSKVFNTISYTHEHAPSLSVAAYLFDNVVLHKRIREQGGAYGCGASSNTISGSFYFYSSSDPCISRTLDAFEESIQTICEGKFSDEDLEETQLEIVQGLDSPVPPGSRGKLEYSWLRKGQTLEKRQAFRDKLLSLEKKDVIAAVEAHIVPNWRQGATVTFADQELLEKENALLRQEGKEPLQILAVYTPSTSKAPIRIDSKPR